METRLGSPEKQRACRAVVLGLELNGRDTADLAVKAAVIELGAAPLE